jgi:hypothetical protein
MRIFLQRPPEQLSVRSVQAIRRRLLFALATVAPQIATVAIRLIPGGGTSPQGCRLVVRLMSGAEMVIEQFDDDPLEAVGRAAAQAERWVRLQVLAGPLSATYRR